MASPACIVNHRSTQAQQPRRRDDGKLKWNTSTGRHRLIREQAVAEEITNYTCNTQQISADFSSQL